MKLKTLILIPFLLTGCTKAIEEEIHYDTLSTVEEPPIKEVEAKNESMLDYGRGYLGVNVRIDAPLGTINVPDDEHCPFKPDFRESLNYSVNSGFNSENSCLIASESFEGLCSQFKRAFFKDGLEEHVSDYDYPKQKEEKILNKRLKDARIANYLAPFFKNTRYQLDIEEKKTFILFSELLGTSSIASASGQLPHYCYKDSYIEELKAVIEKDDYETYCAFFDKYGTHYISEVIYAPKRMIYAGFTSKKGYTNFCRKEYNQKAMVDDIKQIQDLNYGLMLNDYWINESEYSSSDSEGRGMKVIAYKTHPFYEHLPEKYELYKYDDQVEAAYKKYANEKAAALEKESEIENVLPSYIKDSIDIAIEKPVSLKKNKAFKHQFNYVEAENVYSPELLYNKDYTKLYFRPRVTLEKEAQIDIDMMIGGKRVKASNNIWYQTDVKSLFTVDANVHFKVIAKDKLTIESCSVDLCYTK